MKDELFKKVFIKCKADLPPSSGIYIVFVKDDNEINQWSYRKDSPLDEDKDWVEYIDWYLIPVEPTILDKFIESMTEEDIKRLMELKVTTSEKTCTVKDCCHIEKRFDSDRIEYFVCGLNEPKVSVTDEEIEKKFPIEASIIIKSKGWEEPLSLEDQETIAQIILLNFRKQTGAKWVRKQLTGQ
jgi:hypothetical protein